MYSNRSEHSHRRQYSDRSSRHWDGYDDRWEERHETHRDTAQNSYHKYGGDGHNSAERTSRSREYSHSPKRLYSNDSLNRERSRKSPARRRMSSSDWGASEKKRQRFADDDDDDYRYRREPEDKTNRQSPESFSRSHTTKDFKHIPPQEEDFKYRKTAQGSRSRFRHEEFAYRQQQDDLDCRWSFGHYKDKDERNRDHSQEKRRSQDRSTESYGKPRARNDSPSTDHEDHCGNRGRFSVNGSSRQSLSNQSAAVPEQKKSAKGFQRFLDVLNKGVNVAMLTKIVAQSSADVDDPPRSPSSFVSTADRSWSPGCAGRQHGSHQSASLWSESEGSQRRASPQPRPRSFSPKGCSLSHEKSLQRGDGELHHFSSSSRSGTPPVVEKTPLTPEDEHKHRQMQDVLQAIGMNLGFEELGQMSHRIQERLYGKKDSDRSHHRRGSRERDTRRAASPRLQSRSSSSRSSFSPSTLEHPLKNDASSAQRDGTEVHEADEYGHNSSSSPRQDSETFETYSQESLAPHQAFSQNLAYTLSEPSPAPVMPMYSPVNCSTLPYPALPPPLPPALPPPLPPALPPYLSRVGPRVLVPRRPPLLPFPCVPPLNLFPTVLSQTRHLLPQHVLHPQQPFFNLPNIYPAPPLNMSKSKAVSRPRCLQVVETKQPG